MQGITSTRQSLQPVPFALPLTSGGFERISAFGPIATNRILVFLSDEVYKFIRSYSQENEPREVGGVLLGQYCCDHDVRFIMVPTVVACDLGDATPVSISFPPEFWQQVEQVQTVEYPGLVRLGPYHSHPGYGVHPSPIDEKILRAFTRPHHISVIYDPHKDEIGYTCWQESSLLPPSGCFVFEHHQPDTLMRQLQEARPG